MASSTQYNKTLPLQLPFSGPGPRPPLPYLCIKVCVPCHPIPSQTPPLPQSPRDFTISLSSSSVFSPSPFTRSSVLWILAAPVPYIPFWIIGLIHFYLMNSNNSLAALSLLRVHLANLLIAISMTIMGISFIIHTGLESFNTY